MLKSKHLVRNISNYENAFSVWGSSFKVEDPERETGNGERIWLMD
jgi:hypothetical protein